MRFDAEETAPYCASGKHISFTPITPHNHTTSGHYPQTTPTRFGEPQPGAGGPPGPAEDMQLILTVDLELLEQSALERTEDVLVITASCGEEDDHGERQEPVSERDLRLVERGVFGAYVSGEHGDAIDVVWRLAGEGGDLGEVPEGGVGCGAFFVDRG